MSLPQFDAQGSLFEPIAPELRYGQQVELARSRGFEGYGNRKSFKINLGD